MNNFMMRRLGKNAAVGGPETSSAPIGSRGDWVMETKTKEWRLELGPGNNGGFEDKGLRRGI